MKRILSPLSFGGGQDSTALFYLYLHSAAFRRDYAPGQILVMMADTGNEHPSTYEHVEEISYLSVKYGIPFYLIKPKMGFHTPSAPDLLTWHKKNNTIPGKCFPKSCTDRLKIQVLYKFLEAWIGKYYGYEWGDKKAMWQFTEEGGEINVLIGIAKGEERRVAEPSGNWTNPKRWQSQVKRTYPLIPLGLDRKGCQELIRSYGYPVPMPSNCMTCPFMNELDLVYLNRFHPEMYHEWVIMEKNKIDHHEGDEQNLGAWGKIKGEILLLPDVLNVAKDKYGDMTDDQLWKEKFTRGHNVQSRY